MKKLAGKRTLVFILCSVFAIALLFAVTRIIYGNIFKIQTLKSVIKCDLFEDSKLVDYSYFPGRLSVTLTFPKHQYEEVKGELQSKNVACLFRTIDCELVPPLKIPNTLNKKLEVAEYFVGGPLDNFCGILCRTEDATVFYMTQPSYFISEKWQEDRGRQGGGSSVLEESQGRQGDKGTVLLS